jgi:hypothetical protein
MESAITVDDTGARHKATNGFCTQIGNDDFAWFGTTGSKSRLNFLELLHAGHSDYVINDEALAYMRERSLAFHVLARLAEHPDKWFPDDKAWSAHLDALGITALKINPDPVLIATEGALWGSVKANGLLPHTVIVSDDAGQFNVGAHGLCCVHAERLVHKLDTFTAEHRAAQAAVRSQIWEFYADLKAYRQAPTPEHPEIPLHTNGSENDIRCHVTRRKVSGGTRSDRGRECRDPFLGLAKTCAKHAIAFWDYLGDRAAETASAGRSPSIAAARFARRWPITRLALSHIGCRTGLRVITSRENTGSRRCQHFVLGFIADPWHVLGLALRFL